MHEATRGWPEIAIYAVGTAGLLVAALRGSRYALIIHAWLALAVIWGNLPPGVPGCALITNDVLAISLFLPVALGWGFGMLALWNLLPPGAGRVLHPVVLAVTIAACTTIVLLGSLNMLTLINPDTQLVRKATNSHELGEGQPATRRGVSGEFGSLVPLQIPRLGRRGVDPLHYAAKR